MFSDEGAILADGCDRKSLRQSTPNTINVMDGNIYMPFFSGAVGLLSTCAKVISDFKFSALLAGKPWASVNYYRTVHKHCFTVV